MARDLTDALIIDCDSCSVRGIGCDDCVMSVLLEAPPEWASPDEGDGAWVALDPAEARALDVLAEGGLLPPLRLTPRAETG
jgi:hypothetical protein